MFFGRVPVVIGNERFVGDDVHKMDFVFKIPPSLPPEDLMRDFQKILDTPLSELIERGKAARNYFQSVIVEYYKDPTKTFLTYLHRKGLFNER